MRPADDKKSDSTRLQNKLRQILKTQPLYIVGIDSMHCQQKAVQTLHLCQLEDDYSPDTFSYPPNSYIVLHPDAFAYCLERGLVKEEYDQLVTYYLPWKCNAITHLELETKADFFLTPTLAGCTFATMIEEKTTRVYHANFINDSTDKIDQPAIDRQLSELTPKQRPHFTLKKADYSSLSPSNIIGLASVVGFRNEQGQWGFESQYYYYNVRNKTSSVKPGKCHVPRSLTDDSVHVPRSLGMRLCGLFRQCCARKQKPDSASVERLGVSGTHDNEIKVLAKS